MVKQFVMFAYNRHDPKVYVKQVKDIKEAGEAIKSIGVDYTVCMFNTSSGREVRKGDYR